MTHYFKRHQSKPLARWPTPEELRRFLAFVKIGEVPEGQTEPCWNWIGHKDEAGYGQFKFDGQAQWAHRFAFQALRHQKLPKGKEADHICHNPSCVNPAHLEEETKSKNTAKGNRHRKKKPKLEDAPF